MFFKTLAVKHHRDTNRSSNTPNNYHGNKQVVELYVRYQIISTLNTGGFYNPQYRNEYKHAYIDHVTAALKIFNEPVINDPD
jgi:hypothetical protein